MAITAAELMVTVGADTSRAEQGLQSVSSRLDNLSRSFGASGAGLTGAITAPVLGIGAAIGKIGIDFESAFTGVIKTVDASESEIAGLREGILAMARDLPASASEIAAVAESAGQLGIATDSILDFTRTMIDLGETTNLSSEMAASQLARLANITGMPQTEFDRLGSTIVALGNNLATTEADIVSMAMRIAGAGSQVGMSEAEILSFAGALSSVGIEAEAGGSAISRVFIDMANAAATGGADLEAFASVAGMSAEEFATAFQSDAAGAAISFIQGLNGISESGGNVFAVLEDLGLSEIRVRDALLRASGASDLFTGAIALGSQAWADNTALTNEAALRYGTTASQIDTLKNRVVELGINGFERLRPQIEGALEGLERILDRVPALIDGFADLDPAIRNGALAFGAILFVAGPVLLGLAGIAAGLSFILSTIGLVVVAVAGLAAAWATDFGGMRTAVTGWWEGSQPALDEAREWLTTQGPAAMEAMSGAWATLTETFAPATNRITESFGTMLAGFTDMGGSLDGLGTAFGDLGTALIPIAALIGVVLVGAVNFLMNALSGVMTRLPAMVTLVVEQVTAIIDTVATVLENATTLVLAVIEGDWSTAWDSAGNIVIAFGALILGSLERLGGLLGFVLGALKDAVVNTLADFGIDVAGPFDEVEKNVREFWTWLTGLTWDDVWTDMGNGFAGVVTRLSSWSWPALPTWTWPEISVPEWVTQLLNWRPSLPGGNSDSKSSGSGWNFGWVGDSVSGLGDMLSGWSWPRLPEFAWPALPRFEWPSWSWPRLPTWVWPEIPRPSWVDEITGGRDNNAAGSVNYGGGLTWVGERGPELLALPGGSRIFNNNESMAMAGGGGVTVQITGPVTVAGDMDIEEFALKVARAIARRR